MKETIKTAWKLHKLCNRFNVNIEIGGRFINFTSGRKEDIEQIIKEIEGSDYKQFGEIQYSRDIISIAFKKDK